MSESTPPPEFDATLTSRYECKYLIDEQQADQIRQFLRVHTALDPFSARSADHRYRVHSLYLDSLGLRLYQDTSQGRRNRYKLRLRYYSEEGDGPVFFEVKKRADVIVRKSRERMTRVQAEEFLTHGMCHLEESHGPDLFEFFQRCRECGALPALRIRYWREAWESLGVDPVRITFDTQVEHCMLSSKGLKEQRPDWRRTPLASNVILEVKFTDLRPHWIDHMLRLFQLNKLSVAKYAESVESLQDEGQLGLLAARMGLNNRFQAGEGVA